MVIATIHGRWCEHIYDRVQYIFADKRQKIVADFHASGYGYAHAESHDFIEHDYGISLALPHATIKGVETIPSVKIYSYMEQAWSDHQDIVVLNRPGSIPHALQKPHSCQRAGEYLGESTSSAGT